MLDGGIIQKLLEEKWKTFARNQFLKRLLILVLHLLFLSMAVFLRPEDQDESLLAWSDDVLVIARFVCEICTILNVLSYVILQQGDEIRNQGLFAFLSQQLNSPPKLIFLVSNLLILACIPCRLHGDRQTEEAILCFAVPGSWFLLMFFAGAIRLTGPFVTMIYSMITGDMLTFGIIYTIVLFGFSQSFYFLYKGFPGVKSSLYNTYASTWMALFQITLGNYDYQELGMTTYPSVSKTVFGLFMVFVPILLLNMLIAMMGNTYAHVIEQSEKEWVKQWAKIVIALERAIPQADAHHYLQEYSISLGPSEADPGVEKRGVLIIKSKSKTRAKQRKGAVANWKRVCKVTVGALKKRGLTGEQMRCIMWGRESISTPAKAKRAEHAPGAANLAEAFGEALTTALDVMSFTYDLELASPCLHLAGSSRPVDVNAKVAPNGGMVGALDQLTDAAGCSRVAAGKTEVVSEDPLRELVIKANTECDPEKLKFLALSAANLKATDDLMISGGQAKGSVKSLAGIFAGTETFVRKVEKTIKKKYAALEPSDSEGFGEPPVLGKVSRTKRAKSANLRNSSAKSKSSDRKKLMPDSQSSSTDTIVETKVVAEDDLEDDAEARIRKIRDDLKNTIDVSQIRPINIDFALGGELVSTLKVQGSGEGVDAQSSNTKKRRKRAKTAKHNKVAPSVNEGRPFHSAIEKPNDDGSDESPDPLEPWSMKQILNMNKILAWENEEDSI